MLRVGVVGVGHFGKEHARIYASSDACTLVAVCDIDDKNGAGASAELGVPLVSDYRDLIGRVDAVTLAAPTTVHHGIACDLLGTGISVLVEKPIAASLEEADEMIRAASGSGAILQVGHLERFNPAISAATEVANHPRFFEAHRLSIFTPRSLDIDVVMDLMIHDIDVVLSLVSSEITDIRAAGVPVITPRVDIASARIEFNNGCIANLTASRVSAERVRRLRFFQPGQYVAVDYYTQEAFTVSVASGAPGALPEFKHTVLPIVRGESLRFEIASFLEAVGGRAVKVTGEDGRRALAVALEINQRIEEHARKTGLHY